MIKVSVMYPYTAGARFDHTYYREKHMPMVKQRLGAACLYYTVDKGIAGGAPGTDPVYVARCDFICTSLEAFQAAREPHAQEIVADIANYTDIQPALQISEVIVERSET
ncbi:EthD family reductase [Burkholderia multivorans]|uniref:EthD family reductase n=1 Tax=Burkholderia multivorans TaxID=87883 RepID=A0AB37AIP5_9BURK|nr:EthD family reductase [Burkholderia multivorans]PRE39491.1 EthD family reductase [Burkholderia multivorans]PRE43326.1 EthD family reductase [Burkholderia multivorans]